MASFADFLAVLTVPVESLIVPADQMWFEEVVDEWDLPAADRAALREWGLPRGPRARPEPQAEPEPTLVPNVAGPVERRQLSPQDRLYKLGWWGADEYSAMVGAVAGDGRVMGIRPKPMTLSDLPRDLRPYNPGFYEPAVVFGNSSVASYAEISWRWYAAVTVIRQIEEPRGFEALAFRDQEMEHRQRFLAGLAAIDPALADPELQAVWADTVLGD